MKVLKALVSLGCIKLMWDQPNPFEEILITNRETSSSYFDDEDY